MDNPTTNFSSGKVSLWAIIILIAVLAVALAEGILMSQILKITREEVPALKQANEEQASRYVLDKFLEARIANQRDQALIYLTERAMEQYSRGEFDLIKDFRSFEVTSSEKLKTGDGGFRFLVKLNPANGITSSLEAITVIKILDSYYVDSIELAG